MCLIVFKEKGVIFPAIDVFKSLEYSYKNGNNNRSGFAVKRNGSIAIQKGFMNTTLLIKAIKEYGVKKSDEIMIHLRNPSPNTGYSSEYSHPFICDNTKTMEIDFSNKHPVMCHNGKYNDAILPEKVGFATESDTSLMAKRILSQPHMINIFNLFHRNKNLKSLYTHIMGTNKTVVMHPDPRRKADLWGEFIKENNGVYYSNESHRVPKSTSNTMHNRAQLKEREEENYYSMGCNLQQQALLM